MPSQVWVVVGGGDKGGIVVREGQDTASPLLNERLSTGALVKELELTGERLHYGKVHGTGPDHGWVSTKIPDKNLLLKADDLWTVVGGGDKGGIVVREGMATDSALASERLATGAVIRQLEFREQEGRLRYEKLTLNGPATGWVSIKLPDKELVVKLPKEVQDEPPAAPKGVLGPPLEIKMFNEEKNFSYEGLPLWVSRAAAMAKLKREGKQYLPTPDPPLERLKNVGQLAPYKRLPPNKLKQMLVQNLPGCLFGLPFPRTAAQVISGEYGAEWFTKALHAAGTLPKDNSVVKVTRCQEMDFSGYKKEGGAAMKMFIDLEYAKPDRELHTALFAKYTYDITLDIPGQMTIGNDDGWEVWNAIHVAHLFPFRAPKFYFGDVCRETTAYLIITEAIPYLKLGGPEPKPYDILPTCGKCQDFMLPNPVDYYMVLFGNMGQMGAWDKLGRFDSIFGPPLVYSEEQFLAANQRQPLAKQLLEATNTVVNKTMDTAIDFIYNWCKNIAPAEIRDMDKLQKVKAELVEMGPYFKDLSDTYQTNNSNWIAANHSNLQSDNAWFWKDEYGDMAAGVLDWSGFMRSPFAVRFLGCLSGADADDLLGHIDGIMKCYVDEYARCGGPTLSATDLVRRYHLAFITSLYDQVSYVQRHTFKESTLEEMQSWTSDRDPRFQERFFTRCGTMPSVNAWTYYIKRGNLKAIFDEWKAGDGKPYLQEYV